ncbi:MAG TPA: amidohydrolase family protein [Vicinamibacterales bacterium]
MTRLLLVAPVTALLLLVTLQWSMRPDYDLLLTNGRVLDGSGNPWMRADIAVSGGRVVVVGDIDDAAAARVIDVEGLVVAPGFIDVHSHAARGLAGSLNTAVPLLAQGITTVVINPDGGGPIDLTAQRAELSVRGVGVNVAQFVPHGSIRRDVMGGDDRPPTADELARMQALVRRGMQAGAVGLSTGLYYAPGSYADTEEVIALARVVAETGGLYSSHIRDEADYSIGVVAAVEEVVRIADEARVIGIVSHMKALGPKQWGLGPTLTDIVRRARDRGVTVYADQYPYEASGTSLWAALVPKWAQAGGRQRFIERVKGTERAKIRDGIADNIARRGGPSTLVIAGYAADRTLEGRSLEDIATARGVAPADLVIDLLAQRDGSLVSFNMSEEDIVHIMRQPWTMTCSDGELTEPGAGKPHPRGYGAFARKLAVYVRERGVLDLPDAVRSMTSLPATVFGLKDRGVIRRGARADLVVFDPAALRDVATYAEPQRLAEGMRYVFVNGEAVIDAGKPTGRTPGQMLDPQRR